MIGIENVTVLLSCLLQQRGAIVEADGAGRADRRAGRTEVTTAALGAEIAFDRMVLLGVVADRAVGAGQRALTATGTAAFVDRYHAGDRILGDRLGINRAGAQAGGTLALLAGDGEEIEARRQAGLQVLRPVVRQTT